MKSRFDLIQQVLALEVIDAVLCSKSAVDSNPVQSSLLVCRS